MFPYIWWVNYGVTWMKGRRLNEEGFRVISLVLDKNDSKNDMEWREKKWWIWIFNLKYEVYCLFFKKKNQILNFERYFRILKRLPKN